ALPIFERRMVQVDSNKYHLPKTDRGVHHQWATRRRAHFFEQHLAADIFEPRDIGPIALEKRLVKRQLGLRKVLEATPLAQRVHFEEFAGKQNFPGAISFGDFRPAITNTENDSTARERPL